MSVTMSTARIVGTVMVKEVVTPRPCAHAYMTMSAARIVGTISVTWCAQVPGVRPRFLSDIAFGAFGCPVTRPISPSEPNFVWWDHAHLTEITRT